jgi:phosphocarrier protein HPr
MSNPVEGTFDIINQLGLHARAAAQLVKVANRYPCEVQVECEGQAVNGKSIMGVLMLAAAMGMRITVKCAGERAGECLEEIRGLVANRFGEEK